MTTDFASYCGDFPEGKQLIVHRLIRDECADELARLHDRREKFLALVNDTMIQLGEM